MVDLSARSAQICGVLITCAFICYFIELYNVHFAIVTKILTKYRTFQTFNKNEKNELHLSRFHLTLNESISLLFSSNFIDSLLPGG